MTEDNGTWKGADSVQQMLVQMFLTFGSEFYSLAKVDGRIYVVLTIFSCWKRTSSSSLSKHNGRSTRRLLVDPKFFFLELFEGNFERRSTTRAKSEMLPKKVIWVRHKDYLCSG